MIKHGLINGILKKNRYIIEKELSNSSNRKFFSPVRYAEYRITVPAIFSNVHGKFIDIGCGMMPYKKLINDKVTQYDSVDFETRVPGVTFITNVQNMDMISDSTYDSMICLNVLEHVPDPFLALSEMYRILKPTGNLVLSAPHLSRLHEEPYDFFRYTKYGLETLLRSAGFEIIEIIPTGGLFCFIGHQFSTIFVCLFWNIPIIKHIVFFINKYLCVKICWWLDQILDKKKIFAMGYTCIAKK